MIATAGMATQSPGEISPDLLERTCIEESDIPKLFPQDKIAAKFGALQRDDLCSNSDLPSGKSRVQKYDFSMSEIRAVDKKLPNETSMKRTVEYEVRITVRDPNSATPLTKKTFTVTTASGVSRVTTDERGSLNFKDSVEHRRFAPERYILKVVRVADELGFSKRFLFAINPWDTHGFTFGRDLGRMTKQSIALANLQPPAVSSEILTDRVKLETVDFIRTQPNQEAPDAKLYQLSFMPRTRRSSMLTSSRIVNERLHDGTYILQYAFGPARYLDPSRSPLAAIPLSGQKFIDVVDGVFSTEILFSDLNKAIGQGMTEIHVRLLPIKEELLSSNERHLPVSTARFESLIDRKSELLSPRFAGHMNPASLNYEGAVFRQRD